MPFVSNKQRAFLFANKPKVAKKFAADSSGVTPMKPYSKLSSMLAPKAPLPPEALGLEEMEKKKKLY